MGRINKVIELLEQGQPAYSTPAPELTYESGLEASQTWADMLLVEFEHFAFDIKGLTDFMRGLKDGGPTPSGHRTPTVVASLPSNCRTRDEVIYNAWQTRHVLSTGAHGINHTHARDPEAVKAYVATARYSFQKIGRDLGIPEGMRGGGGQTQPAAIWGISPDEYLRRADPWPLNPDGELLLGLKIEDRHALPNADAIAATPGIYFAEWGPGDMSMSFGDPALRSVPYPPELLRPMNIVVQACHKAGIAFHGGWPDTTLSDDDKARYVIEELGARIVGTGDRGIADAGRKLTGRTMPV